MENLIGNGAGKVESNIGEELLTKDPELLNRFTNGGEGAENLPKGKYLMELIKSLAGEFGDDDALSGITGSSRMEQLLRKHPKSMSNMFTELGNASEEEEQEVVGEQSLMGMNGGLR